MHICFQVSPLSFATDDVVLRRRLRREGRRRKQGSQPPAAVQQWVLFRATLESAETVGLRAEQLAASHAAEVEGVCSHNDVMWNSLDSSFL